MAEFEGMAKALQIDSKILKDLGKVDKRIQSIADNSERMAKAFQAAMSSMSGNSGELIQTLGSINNILKGMGNESKSGLGKVSTGIKDTSKEAEKAAAALAKAVEAVDNFEAKSLNIAELRAAIKAANKELREGEGISPHADQQYMVDVRKYLQDELKAQETSTEEIRRNYEKAKEREAKEDEKRYQEWLKLKDKEVREAKRAEEQKLRDRQKAINDYLKLLERQQQRQARIDSRNRRNDYNRYVTSTEGALRTAGRANTYTQRAQAIKNIEVAMKNLRTSDANYQRDLARLTDAHKRLIEEQRKFEQNLGRIERSEHNLMNTSQQLARQLALIFSVSAIEGYVIKLIEVRGEFEKQNVALATLLGNQDQANKLQGQITELAVQSPFSLRELTSYTKSLAAYNVEYEELYDTTKMLADVSSGLGVEMQRLILAFGQVKAANFLRGTETRQFTEAGINMLGELAKYYSELEGRIVSVGEVQERQFKRMISFQDVEQVFKRITSEGGMFFEMQERQAATLAGMYTNLTDSVDVMLNEIGIANEGILKGAVSVVRDVVVNWKEVLFVIRPVVNTLGSYIAVATLARIGTSSFAESLSRLSGHAATSAGRLRLLSAAMTTVKNAARGLAVSLAAILPVALIGGLIELVRRLTEASRAATEFRESIIKITNTGTLKASELAANFERLANEAVNAADGSEEQNKALEKLNKTYEDIIPQDEMKIARLREMKGAYDSVTAAIYNKIEADTRENLIQQVNTTYGTKAVEAMSELTDKLTEYGISQQKARTITQEFKRQWDAGQISSSNALEKLRKIVQDYTGEFVKLTETGIIKTDAGKQFGQVQIDEITKATAALTRYDVELDRVMIKPSKAFRAGGGTAIYDQLSKELGKAGKVAEKWQKDNRDKFKLSIEFSEESKKTQINAYQKFIDDVNKKIESGEIKGVDVTSARLAIEEAQEAIEKVNISDTIKDINALRLSMSKQTGVDFGKLNFTEMKATDGLADYRKSVQEMLKTYEDAVKTFDEYSAKGESMPWLLQEELLQGIGSEEELRKRTDALRQYVNVLFGYNEETNKGRGGSNNPALDVLKEQIRLLEEAKNRYDELNKEMSDTDAANAVREQFGNTEIGGVVATMSFDAQGVIDAMKRVFNSLSKTLGDDSEKIIQEAIRPFETELVINPKIERREEIEKQIEDMFNQYDLSIELISSGVPSKMLEELFGTKIVNVEDLKSELDKLKPEIDKQGQNWIDMWNDAQKKLLEIQEKSTAEAVRQYAEQMRKSISERVQIEIEAQKQIAAVQASQKLSPETKKAVTQNIRRSADIEIGKKDWEDFQNSDVYQRMFQDLEYMSTASIERIRAKLDELRDSMGQLSPENLKTINEYYQKLDDAISERNPFGAMRDSLKEINELRSQGRTEEFLNEELLRLDVDKSNYEQQINDLETIIGMKEQGLSLDNLSEEVLLRNNGILNETTENLRQQLSIRKQQLGKTNMNIGITQKDLNSYVKARNNANKLSGEIQSIQTLGKTAFGSISEIMDSMGSGMDENEKIIADMAGSLLDLVAQAVLFGIQLQVNTAMAEVFGTTLNAALGPIGWAVMALQALTAIFSAFSKIHDNKIQAQIDAEQEKIDNLNRTYERLEDTIEKGLSIEQFTKNSELVRNLYSQIDSYQKMINLERDKKKTDHDQIKEWQNTIGDLYTQIQELYENLKEELVGSFKDASQELADSLASAFENGENAAVSWGDTVNEIIADIIKNAIATRLIEPMLQPVLDEFFSKAMPNTTAAQKANDKLLELQKRYEEVTKSTNDWVDAFLEENNLVKNSKNLVYALDEYYKMVADLENQMANLRNSADNLSETAEGEEPQITQEYVDKLKSDIEAIYGALKDEELLGILDDIIGGGGDTMSGLQKSIQGLTEDTGEALAALLESVRFFVSDSNVVMHNIYNWLTTMPAETPLMQELKLQTQHLASMDNLLTSVIKSSGGKGRVLRVEIV